MIPFLDDSTSVTPTNALKKEPVRSATKLKLAVFCLALTFRHKRQKTIPRRNEYHKIILSN